MSERSDNQRQRVIDDLAPTEMFEIRTPSGPVTIRAPRDWTVHDTAVVDQIMEVLGYKPVPSNAGKGGPMFAYAPKLVTAVNTDNTVD